MATADVDAALTGGNYEVLRARLAAAGAELAKRADALNLRRKAVFGATEPQLIATERVRTEHNCAPVDMVAIGGHLLLGYNVFLGLKAETKIADVLALHQFEALATGGFETAALPQDALGGFLTGGDLARDFANLYRYYRDARLIQLVKRTTQLLAVFQAGATWRDIKVLRWRIEPTGAVIYVDDRGDRDYADLFPQPYDFEWREVTRDNQVSGKHPHYNILDAMFVECVGGDLTIKVENNTESGQGVYSEAVDDHNQSLDDAKIFYAPIGSITSRQAGLVVLKILPFRETVWRYLVFDTRSRKVVRADGIGQGCRSLPEDHGIIFPGGYVLVGGERKLFDGDHADYVLERELKSPNGEDVLYVYQRGTDGTYVLCPYNLIEKGVAAPIVCSGYSLFADGRMVVMRAASAEPTRVHPMQVWQTPFTSAEHAASAPTDGSYLAKVGNADLVRGLSDALSISRLAGADKPQRTTFEDILALSTRATDAYYWLGHADANDLKTAVADVKSTAKLILDEYEKVLALEAAARKALVEAEELVVEKLRATRSEGWDRIDPFLEALTGLRGLRGQLISKKEIRFIDVKRLGELEVEVTTAFDRVTTDCVALLAKGDAFGELVTRANTLAARVTELVTAIDTKPVREQIDQVAAGLDLLGNVIGSLKIEDTTKRTVILENITDAFGQVNRARAVIEGRHRELAAKEGRAEFGAQVKLLTQSVASALAQCDTPERCDQELTRLLVQLEELEGRFADIDELTAELASKREEIVDAVGARKQLLAAERQRRAANLQKAATRILEGVARRASSLATSDEVNAYFASDAMVQKLRDIVAEMGTLGDTVKADELEARLKSARQDALRGQRDRADLFEGGGELIRFGTHRFTVNTQPLELMIVPHDDGLAVHLAGTDFYEAIDDAQLVQARHLWHQDLPSESPEVYRGEYLAASVLALADSGSAGTGALTLSALYDALRAGTLEAVLRQIAQERYDEGYERGVHDHDAAKILARLLAMREGAGLLAFPASARALAIVFWGSANEDATTRSRWHRSAQSLARLADVLGDRGARTHLAADIGGAIRRFVERDPALMAAGLALADADLAATYLVRELAISDPRFIVSGAAIAIADALHLELDARAARLAFDDDTRAFAGAPGAALLLARAWVDGIVARKPELAPAAIEAAAYLATPALSRDRSSAVVDASVTGLLGRHPRITDGALPLRLDELTTRLERFRRDIVPAFRAYRTLRAEIVERERRRLRLDELKPRVMSSFVRNQLIDQVYLPLCGANLAKQLGAAGAAKRTDQMGMLLLISPPGYGKTTLMEYVAARLGLAFVKVNGPALGHAVTSLDPAEAPNATSRQEIEKVSLALEMGTNVMLYLDDIQHTSPELLQKFISLCDAQRKIEGVWRGRTRTYDLRGKKFCVVMAGNPYTESGEQFKIPDMLANRADVYNLGDVLSGKTDAFALSFLENALTSSPTLAPLATRDLGDVHKIIRMAKGEPIPTTELSHGYAGVELEEVLAVIRHLFVAQETLLKVNQEYIRSAGQADAFRTEPPFKLQGSYRNMNKIAEKVVSAMTPAELDRLVDDHYQGESQTLTTAAEQNLLKLGELRSKLTPEQAQRWAEIKLEFVRQRRMGGGDADPVTKLVGTLSGLATDLGTELGAIRSTLGNGTGTANVTIELRELREALLRAAQKTASEAAARDPASWLGERLDAIAAGLRSLAERPQQVEVHQSHVPAHHGNGNPTAENWDAAALLAQVKRIETSLVPVVSAAVEQRGSDTVLANKMVQIIELLEQLDARLSPGR
ncbi:MAG: DNA repair ATPase [Deltaproteobacteria bacterium]|nr:DNA repair ATPase [Deltaproteobacteria bacterium]MDQ3296592.1 DNA repair ATPase [Myxococcota bacterium]